MLRANILFYSDLLNCLIKFGMLLDVTFNVHLPAFRSGDVGLCIGYVSSCHLDSQE